MIDYKEGLSNGEIFNVFIARIFFTSKYDNFRKAIEAGQQPIFAYKWNIKY